MLLCPGTLSWAQGRRGGPMMGRRPQPSRPQKMEKPPRTPIEEFQRMSPEKRAQALERLPPQQRERIQQRLDQYDRLPPEQKARLQRLWQLPPEEQQQVRNAVRQFGQLPQERKQALRREMRDMRPMTESERRAHMDSPEFKDKFSKDEQDMMKHMSEVLEPPEQ